MVVMVVMVLVLVLVLVCCDDVGFAGSGRGGELVMVIAVLPASGAARPAG